MLNDTTFYDWNLLFAEFEEKCGLNRYRFACKMRQCPQIYYLCELVVTVLSLTTTPRETSYYRGLMNSLLNPYPLYMPTVLTHIYRLPSWLFIYTSPIPMIAAVFWGLIELHGCGRCWPIYLSWAIGRHPKRAYSRRKTFYFTHE